MEVTRRVDAKDLVIGGVGVPLQDMGFNGGVELASILVRDKQVIGALDGDRIWPTGRVQVLQGVIFQNGLLPLVIVNVPHVVVAYAVTEDGWGSTYDMKAVLNEE